MKHPNALTPVDLTPITARAYTKQCDPVVLSRLNKTIVRDVACGVLFICLYVPLLVIVMAL